MREVGSLCLPQALDLRYQQDSPFDNFQPGGLSPAMAMTAAAAEILRAPVIDRLPSLYIDVTICIFLLTASPLWAQISEAYRIDGTTQALNNILKIHGVDPSCCC